MNALDKKDLKDDPTTLRAFGRIFRNDLTAETSIQNSYIKVASDGESVKIGRPAGMTDPQADGTMLWKSLDDCLGKKGLGGTVFDYKQVLGDYQR
jgi:hypothetical protein